MPRQTAAQNVLCFNLILICFANPPLYMTRKKPDKKLTIFYKSFILFITSIWFLAKNLGNSILRSAFLCTNWNGYRSGRTWTWQKWVFFVHSVWYGNLLSRSCSCYRNNVFTFVPSKGFSPGEGQPRWTHPTEKQLKPKRMHEKIWKNATF